VLPGGLRKGLGLSPVRLYELFLYVSEVLSRALGGGDFSPRFGLLDLSHKEVKLPVGILGFIGFFLFIALAA